MADPRVVDLLVAQQAQARMNVRRGVVAQLLQLWRSLTGQWWYDGRRVQRFATDAAAVVRSGQRMTADVTDEYLRRVLDEYGALPRHVQPMTLPEQLRGVDLADVYERPVRDVRYLRSTDVPEPEAVTRAEQRLENTATLDLALAMREASRQRLASADKVSGYRRVLHPELAVKTGQVCGLCIVASDRIYKRGDLLPIHGGCHCETLPIIGEQDPGRSLNAEDLAVLYRAGGGTSREVLRKVRITIRDHGEIGPVLTDADQHFRDPDEVAA